MAGIIHMHASYHICTCTCRQASYVMCIERGSRRPIMYIDHSV